MAADTERVHFREWTAAEQQPCSERDNQDDEISRLMDHGSISFGRFANESLDWEKRSVFTHNRCREELKKFTNPGLVAQKKAYFEEYYKRVKVLKGLEAPNHDSQEQASFCAVSNYISKEVEHQTSGQEEKTDEYTTSVEKVMNTNGQIHLASNITLVPNDGDLSSPRCPLLENVAGDVTATEESKPFVGLEDEDTRYKQDDMLSSQLMDVTQDGLLLQEHTEKSCQSIEDDDMLSRVQPMDVTPEGHLSQEHIENSCQSIQSTIKNKSSLKKIELSIKKYKEQTSVLKASSPGQCNAKTGANHRTLLSSANKGKVDVSHSCRNSTNSIARQKFKEAKNSREMKLGYRPEVITSQSKGARRKSTGKVNDTKRMNNVGEISKAAKPRQPLHRFPTSLSMSAPKTEAADASKTIIPRPASKLSSTNRKGGYENLDLSSRKSGKLSSTLKPKEAGMSRSISMKSGWKPEKSAGDETHAVRMPPRIQKSTSESSTAVRANPLSTSVSQLYPTTRKKVMTVKNEGPAAGVRYSKGKLANQVSMSTSNLQLKAKNHRPEIPKWR